jgi:hypothetical protein
MSEVVMFNPAAYGGAASGGGGAAQAYNPIAPQGGTRRDYVEDNPETDYEREQRFLVMKAIENGEFILMPRIINVPAMTYVFDVQITYPSGVVESFDPDYFKIIQDISR